ncbi:hypothetical protein AVEN_16685-1 [Araneus ventricosus]|uniref:Uncharacterized protein n=1 Tax=Araneus ventricosus TaxID=182803 RepID=A0A4Y2SYK8_ARAVE|nr:hypothetical protein AVEN_16685-1 [Araneus ventricosus]
MFLKCVRPNKWLFNVFLRSFIHQNSTQGPGSFWTQPIIQQQLFHILCDRFPDVVDHLHSSRKFHTKGPQSFSGPIINSSSFLILSSSLMLLDRSFIRKIPQGLEVSGHNIQYPAAALSYSFSSF